MTKLVAFCCDANERRGVGHVMRCLALAEEFAARGYRPVFASNLGGVAWLEEELRRRDFPVITSSLVSVEPMLQMAPIALVIDSYDMSPERYHLISGAALPILAIHDGEHGRRHADLTLDQNLGAYGADLSGIRYALLRDDIVRLRPERPRAGQHGVPPKVLAFFGGTDAFGAAPTITRALAATGLDFDATVVAATESYARLIEAVRLTAGQRVTVIPAGSALTAHIADADLVIAASGSTLWELMCVGAAAAVVSVAANQDIGYRKVVATGVAAGLGSLADVVMDPAAAPVEQLRALLLDGGERDRLRADGWALVDGLGRQRVADALLAIA